MRWRKDKPDLQKWHRSFAWWPVLLDDEHCVAWLETVWRKGQRITGAGTPFWCWQHRDAEPSSDLAYEVWRYGT